MTKHLDRISGTFFLILGAALYLWIIPEQTELVTSGWVRPATVPKAMAIVIALGGAWAALRPVANGLVPLRHVLRGGWFMAVLAISLYAIDLAGFVWAAPFLALALLLSCHERRPVWLAVATLAVPFTIWLSFSVILERPLP